MDLTNEIALVQSKTFWAALLSLLAVIFTTFGLSQYAKVVMDPTTLTYIMNAVAILGAVGAIAGRTVARSPVTSLLPKGN